MVSGDESGSAWMATVSAFGLVTAVLRLGVGRPPPPSSQEAEPAVAGEAHPPASAAMLSAGEPCYEAVAAALRAAGFLRS